MFLSNLVDKLTKFVNSNITRHKVPTGCCSQKTDCCSSLPVVPEACCKETCPFEDESDICDVDMCEKSPHDLSASGDVELFLVDKKGCLDSAIVIYIDVGDCQKEDINEFVKNRIEQYKGFTKHLPRNVGVLFVPNRNGMDSIEHLNL
jgi:hypothetical protein